MEHFNTEVTLPIVDIGIFGIAHLAIIINRNILKTRFVNQKFNYALLYLEHYVSYLTMCMGIEGINQLLHLNIDPYVFVWPFMRAIMGDFIFPMSENDKADPQFDQLFMDFAGITSYLLLKY